MERAAIVRGRLTDPNHVELDESVRDIDGPVEVTIRALDDDREPSLCQTSTQAEWERAFHAWIDAHDRTTPIPTAKSLRREALYGDDLTSSESAPRAEARFRDMPTSEPTDRIAAYRLLETGALVAFDIVETHVEPTPDGGFVRIELQLGELDEDGERTEDHEWGALGFIFCLATLSFHDARPRGSSGMDFADRDQLTIADLHDGLRSSLLSLGRSPSSIWTCFTQFEIV